MHEIKSENSEQNFLRTVFFHLKIADQFLIYLLQNAYNNTTI